MRIEQGFPQAGDVDMLDALNQWFELLEEARTKLRGTDMPAASVNAGEAAIVAPENRFQIEHFGIRP